MPDWSPAELLHPMSLAQFGEQYWQRQVLHIVRNDAGAYRNLIDSATVDHLVATHGGRHDFPISILGGARGSGPHALDGAGERSHWTGARVAHRLAGGATIRIGNVAHYVPAVKRMATQLEAELCADIGVNAYLTPPNAQAFAAHFDKHDVLVLQVEGRKTWKVFSPPEPTPLEVTHPGRSAWFEEKLPGDPPAGLPALATAAHTFHLAPGDLLYVPRGHVHQVVTEGASSLHLTVAVMAVTWYEVAVHALLALAQQHPGLRETLPIGFATQRTELSQAGADAGPIAQLVRAHFGTDGLRHSLQTLAHQFVYSRHADWQGLSGDIARLAQLTTASRMTIRQRLAYTTRDTGSDIVLLFSRRAIRVPLRAQSMLAYILHQRVFNVGDLPTSLGDESRLLLVREMIAKGFLSFADAGPLV